MLSDKLGFGTQWLEQLGLRQSKNVPLLGLDISSTAVKLVELAIAALLRTVGTPHGLHLIAPEGQLKNTRPAVYERIP